MITPKENESKQLEIWNEEFRPVLLEVYFIIYRNEGFENWVDFSYFMSDNMIRDVAFNPNAYRDFVYHISAHPEGI